MTPITLKKPKKDINQAIKESEDELDNFINSKLTIDDASYVSDKINEILGLNMILMTLANKPQRQ